jgi:dihydrofolate synthase/folylpolyglutamate synthase
MRSGADWIASLTPWPQEFGLERMQALLEALANPQRTFPAVHVVGTNGKSTATRAIEEALLAQGLHVGAYLSPHVRAWSERIRVGGEEADFEHAVARVRAAAERLEATQFETLTAAAFAEFADAAVDVAVVEAGLGGRYDATNVLDAPVVLLTNVGLDHTEILGSTREQIAREKLAVVRAGATAVLPGGEFAPLVPHANVTIGGALEAAEAFLGREIEELPEVALPGRLETLGDDEVWDGAHNPDGVSWLIEQLPRRDYTIVASILGDKAVAEMLERLAIVGGRLVATRSTNPRALPADELAARARQFFEHVDVAEDPVAALAVARESPPVLVTGSLYLLADLAALEEGRVN